MRLVLMIFFQVHIKVFPYKHCQGHLYPLDYLKIEIDRYRLIMASKDDQRTRAAWNTMHTL